MLCIANNYRVGGREDDGGLVDRCWDDRPITAVASEAQSCLGVLSKHKLSCKNHKTWQQQHLCPTTEQHCVMWFWLWATGLEFLSWCQRGWSDILFYFVKVFPSCGTFWLIDSHPVFFHLPFHTRLQWMPALFLMLFCTSRSTSLSCFPSGSLWPSLVFVFKFCV